MNTSSVDQRFALLAALGANTDWESLTTEEIQVGILEAKRAGRAFTLFVKNGLGVPENTAPIPAPEPNILWTLVDDGRSAVEIIASIEAKGGTVADWAKDISARSKEPIPPKGTEYPLVGIRGDEFASDAKRTTRAIFTKGECRKYRKPPMRVGLLLREKFITQKEVGHACVAVFHEPIRDAGELPNVLVLDLGGVGVWLYAWYGNDGGRWDREDLFLFLAPQVSQP